MYFIRKSHMFTCFLLSPLAPATPLPPKNADIQDRDNIDDVLKVLSSLNPLIVPLIPLITARDEVAGIHTRDRLDNLLKNVPSLGPSLVSRIARDNTADIEARTLVDEILKVYAKYTPVIAPIVVGLVAREDNAEKDPASLSHPVGEAPHQLNALEDSAVVKPTRDNVADIQARDRISDILKILEQYVPVIVPILTGRADRKTTTHEDKKETSSTTDSHIEPEKERAGTKVQARQNQKSGVLQGLTNFVKASSKNVVEVLKEEPSAIFTQLIEMIKPSGADDLS